jgi:ribosome maturation factor RimP
MAAGKTRRPEADQRRRKLSMDVIARVRRLIEPAIGDLGFEIVRVQLAGKNRPCMQVMVERESGGAITVDDCAQISRAISTILDVEDPIKGTYTLEVSSPGIDRPLVRLGDFQRFRGFQAKIETTRPIDGRRRFKGRLLGVEGDRVRMEVDGGEVTLPHPEIQRAKLVLTDDLIAASQEDRGS